MNMRRLKRRLKRSLCRRRTFYVAVLLLGLFGLSYYVVIDILRTKVEAQAAEMEHPEMVHDMLEDPQGYFANQRQAAFQEYEWAFKALLIAIPVTMATVGIVCILVALRRQVPWSHEHGLNADQQARAKAHRDAVVQKFRR